MRLRRSDFHIWDYHKRRTWRAIRRAVHEAKTKGAALSDVSLMMLAWAMKRANGRAMYYLVHHLPWLVVQCCGGILAEDRPFNGRPNYALILFRTVHSPEEQLFMRMFAARRT